MGGRGSASGMSDKGKPDVNDESIIDKVNRIWQNRKKVVV